MPKVYATQMAKNIANEIGNLFFAGTYSYESGERIINQYLKGIIEQSELISSQKDCPEEIKSQLSHIVMSDFYIGLLSSYYEP